MKSSGAPDLSGAREANTIARLNIDHYVARLNIDHYRGLLTTEIDASKRQIVIGLLAEEEAKLSRMLGCRARCRISAISPRSR